MSSSACAVRRISAEETVPIRWAVLRAGMPREAAIFPGDDLPTTWHFGAFRETTLSGVVSIFPAPFPDQPEVLEAWQLRGMATLPAVRGLGFGRALLATCVATAQAEGGALIWCNARVGATGFYARHGWAISGDEFEVPTAGPHFRMWMRLVPVA